MIDFLFDYGLFSAKAFTLIILLLAGVFCLLMLLATRQREKESIEIEKLNDKLEEMRDALESELLSKEETKLLKKERKKKEKEETKLLKKRAKQGIIDPLRQRIFVLRFNGDLHASEVTGFREAITAILTVAKPEDEVCVILDSSGGIVHNYGLAASELTRFRHRNIPLIVSIDLVAASGGYLMACVANKILAAPFAIVGSIGVLGQVPNFHRFLKKHDIDVEQLTAGEYKTTLTMFGENTEKARQKFQQELEETHTLFKNFISDYRPNLDMNKIATGEYWYGTQALSLNLIDEITTSDDYLLNKSLNADIYEISYVIQETLSDKISSLLHNISSRLQQFFKAPVP